MLDELSLFFIVVLIILGFLAGIINTLAGGGSNLTIPALMVLGLPPDIANATNRISVFLQSLTAAKGFKEHGKLDMPDLKKIIGITLIGGFAGALVASFLPNSLLKPTLLIAMISMALIILVKPSVVAPPDGTVPHKVDDSKQGVAMLLIAGFYGGFVQAGVGFVLILAIAGSLRYDLVRSNALKVVCTLGFTGIALLVFIARNQVSWIPGLLLAAGSIVGAHLAVKLAINISQTALKWFLFIMTICASAAAILT